MRIKEKIKRSNSPTGRKKTERRAKLERFLNKTKDFWQKNIGHGFGNKPLNVMDNKTRRELGLPEDNLQE